VVQLSVNVNKVATLRNARGGNVPSVLDAVRVAVAAGAPGITVHPRADERHITARDVRDIAEWIAPQRGKVEFNIEGDPRPDLIEMVLSIRPDQCTLVPVMPGEITSQAGWPIDRPWPGLEEAVKRLRANGTRVSLFIEPRLDAVEWAQRLGADRIELYTEPYARAYERGGTARTESLALYARAAAHAHTCGLGVNAGHDLDLSNLPSFAAIPHLAEVSIGHALVSHALFVGLDRAVRDYLDAIRSGSAAPGD
jgi:pyridoxine 5-phosphate synthase